MSFSSVFSSLDRHAIQKKISADVSDVIPHILKKNTCSMDDFFALLSPSAEAWIDQMGTRAEQLTTQYFGRAVHLYAPVYLSNDCHNECVYCGFKHSVSTPRKTLSVSEMTQEFSLLADRGICHVLLLTGEAVSVGSEYVCQAIGYAKQYFPEVSLEIFPAKQSEYKQMAQAGATGVTLYQETYDPSCYAEVHVSGKKRDFSFRLDSADRILSSGFRKMGLGVLLGLSDWRLDIAVLALHAHYVLKKYWRSELTLSVPRLHHTPDSTPFDLVSDRHFLQIIFALRILFPRTPLILSTREPIFLRDMLIGKGITQISAGSKTNPGGYTELSSASQFDIEDTRSLSEVISMLEKKDYDPILKNWDIQLQANKV